MENLGINLNLFIAQVVNFVIFFFIFKKYIAGPFTAYMQKQKKKEEDMQRMHREIETKYERMQQEEKKLKLQMQKEREEVLEEAKKAAEQTKQEIITSAKKEADDLIVKGNKQISDERESLYKEVRTKTIDLSVNIVDKALKEYLTEDVKKNLTQYIIKNLGKDATKAD
jgi:F-type H+-transporting ATPase subunit b